MGVSLSPYKEMETALSRRVFESIYVNKSSAEWACLLIYICKRKQL